MKKTLESLTKFLPILLLKVIVTGLIRPSAPISHFSAVKKKKKTHDKLVELRNSIEKEWRMDKNSSTLILDLVS